MTFIEAAEQILRTAGKPLHYKKITEIAIAQNLLSHVGKTPEITMSSRLAMMTKKDRGEAPIFKVKAGVFALREFSQEVIRAAEKDTGQDYEAGEVAVVRRGNGSASARPPRATPKQEPKQEATDKIMGSDETPVEPARKLPGAEVFPEEADDDEPILANLDGDSKDGEDGESESSRRRRGGRRRRGRRNGREGGNEAGSQGGSARADAPREGNREPRPDRDRGRDRGGRDRDRGRDGGRDASRDGGRDRGDAGRDRERIRVERPNGREQIQGDWMREADEGEGLGASLADAVYEVVDRGGEALAYVRIAELLARKGRLSGDAAALVPTVAAAVRSDGARRAGQGHRPRFYVVAGIVALTDWAMPRDAVHAERDAIRFADRQRQKTRRAFVQELTTLPAVGLIEILASWLNAEGVTALRAVRRPGATAQEFNLAGVYRRGPEERSIAIVFARDSSEITAERVIAIRGSLHHFDNATAAWIITPGNVRPDAREEAQTAGQTPCTLFDGGALARSMEKAGVGLVTHQIPVVSIDFALLETLGADTLTHRERIRRLPDGAEDGAAGGDAEGSAREGASVPPGEDAADGDGRPRRRRRRRGRGPRPEGSAEAGSEGSSEEAADGDEATFEDSGAESEELSADAETSDEGGNSFDDEDASDDDMSRDDLASEDEESEDEDMSAADPDAADGSEEDSRSEQ